MKNCRKRRCSSVFFTVCVFGIQKGHTLERTDTQTCRRTQSRHSAEIIQRKTITLSTYAIQFHMFLNAENKRVCVCVVRACKSSDEQKSNTHGVELSEFPMETNINKWCVYDSNQPNDLFRYCHCRRCRCCRSEAAIVAQHGRV